MLVDTDSVIFKSRLLNELFKNDIDYDTAVVLLDCIKTATKTAMLLEVLKSANELVAIQKDIQQ